MAKVIALSLMAFLLIALFWRPKIRALSMHGPLDVDRGIPYPSLSQGSAVFSLTILFTAYVAFTALVGVIGLLGLFAGSLCGLLCLRSVIRRHPSVNSFQHLLSMLFRPERQSGKIFLAFISFTQALLIISEIMILRQISVHWLGMSDTDSMLFVMSISLLGYLYCMIGGYLSVFKTDSVQFVLIVMMCLAILVEGATHSTFSASQITFFGTNLAIWSGNGSSLAISIGMNVLMTFLIGWAFIICGPDTWKRVFIVIHSRERKRPFTTLVVAGFLPLLLLLPIFMISATNVDSDIPELGFLYSAITGAHQLVSYLVLMGIMSAFLSTLDSALISAVHLIHLSGFSKKNNKWDSRNKYYTRIGILFLGINALVAILLELQVRNAYMIASFLAGLMAIETGLLTGLIGLRRTLSAGSMITVIALCLMVWFVITSEIPGITTIPSTEEQIGTLRWGLLILFVVVMATVFVGKREHDVDI